MYLRGGSRLAADPPVLPEPPQGFVQHPMSGICTQSTSQWTAGLTEQLPCTTDDRLDEAAGAAVYTTDPLDRDLSLSGPILANVWLTTTARDAIVTVRVTDVDPSGRSTELTTGWQAASLRAVDASRSRIVKGQMLQPWHPFTRDSALPVPVGQPVEVPVEVFPARAVIKAGHRLRIAISPGDFPHQLPPVPRLLDSLGGYDQVLTDPAHPSYVALPALGDCARGCPPLPVPDLTRG
jgi:putative CocE/NonD family hydrolase